MQIFSVRQKVSCHWWKKCRSTIPSKTQSWKRWILIKFNSWKNLFKHLLMFISRAYPHDQSLSRMKASYFLKISTDMKNNDVKINIHEINDPSSNIWYSVSEKKKKTIRKPFSSQGRHMIYIHEPSLRSIFNYLIFCDIQIYFIGHFISLRSQNKADITNAIRINIETKYYRFFIGIYWRYIE